MEVLLELHDKMKEEFNKTAKYFGEDPTETTTEDFFGIFSAFVDQFEVNNIFIFFKIHGIVSYIYLCLLFFATNCMLHYIPHNENSGYAVTRWASKY